MTRLPLRAGGSSGRRSALSQGKWLVVPVLLAGCLSAPEPVGPLAGQDLVDALRDGGHVLYLRHTETTRGGVDDLSTLGDCSRQRPLSAAGRQDAREIGEAFDALDIPVGQVLASPFCRTLETAELAFGEVRPHAGLLALAPDGSNRSEVAERLRELLADEPADGQNTVLVGHVSNLGTVTPYDPDEGGTIVLRPDGERWTLVGEVPPQGWQRLAEISS